MDCCFHRTDIILFLYVISSFWTLPISLKMFIICILEEGLQLDQSKKPQGTRAAFDTTFYGEFLSRN